MTLATKKNELKILLHDFEFMCSTVLAQMKVLHNLFKNTDSQSLYDEAEANEIILDRLEVKIREEVVFAIFKFTPRASDLRLIIAYQDVTTNIERVGDILLNIIHSLKETNLNHKDFAQEMSLAQKMFDATDEMMRKTITAFTNVDAKLAYEVIKEDDIVDEMFHRLDRMLVDNFANKTLDREQIINIMNFKSMFYHLERIGDSATNIAEATVYLTEGKDIRHTKS